MEITKAHGDDQGEKEEGEIEPILHHIVPKRNDTRGRRQHDKEKEDTEGDQPVLVH